MNIYKYLKLDHDHVSQLFKQFEQSDSSERQLEIVAMICQELIIHAHSEQETFYKKLEHYETTRKIALHGKEEHNEIEDLIKKIKAEKHPNAKWKREVHKLQDLVEHHVHEEEGKIFRKAKKVLSEEEAYFLKEQMHYLKMQLLRDLEAKSPKNKKTAALKTKKASMTGHFHRRTRHPGGERPHH